MRLDDIVYIFKTQNFVRFFFYKINFFFIFIVVVVTAFCIFICNEHVVALCLNYSGIVYNSYNNMLLLLSIRTSVWLLARLCTHMVWAFMMLYSFFLSCCCVIFNQQCWQLLWSANTCKWKLFCLFLTCHNKIFLVSRS